MSTLTRPKTEAVATTPGTLRGSVRVVLRVHRRSLRTLGAVVLLPVFWMVGLSLWTDRIAERFAASGCSVENTVTNCGATVRDYLDAEMMQSDTQSWAGLLMMALPALVGAFVAGPAIARELEIGTFRLSWSQSVSPARWLAAKLLVLAVLTVAAASVLASVCAWFWSRDADAYYSNGWFEWSVYGTTGTVPVAYALLGLALGTLAGVLVRRTVAAMAATAVTYGLVLATFNTVRDSLWPIRTDVFAVGSRYVFPKDSWPVAQGYVTSAGERLPVEICLSSERDLVDCLATHDSSQRYLDHHPASHYWPLQLVETGILLALAALAVFAAFRVLRRLHG
ncbi:ABC transporter permease subunit [Streptomyces parvus]|uniref:ABC transporter permease subunit n=1 Tax=Streptomyces parvus TaxID=66428 RepID=UPI0036273EE5